MSKSKWYVVQVKKNAYNLAEVNLGRQGFRCFQPRLKVTTRSGSVFKEVAKPLFPGYLFVNFDPVNSRWQKINSSLGVSRLLMRGGLPQALPTGVVENLATQLDSTGHLVTSSDFQKGEDVLINAGPFVGFFAQVERLEPNQRVTLLLNIMELGSRLEVDATDINKV